jgi:hypothetical protein
MTMIEENAEQRESRLLRVIAGAKFEILPTDYVWTPLDSLQSLNDQAITCTRDGDKWFQLIPAASFEEVQRYRVVSFHFKEGLYAGGFVPWLAAQVERWAGIGGMLVFTGKDQRENWATWTTSWATFTYWCCGAAAGERFIAVIQDLIRKGTEELSKPYPF